MVYVVRKSANNIFSKHSFNDKISWNHKNYKKNKYISQIYIVL